MVSVNLIAVIALLGAGLGLVAAQCGCLYTDELWGDVNPNVFNLCNPATNTSVQQQCPSGRGFIKNSTFYGCIPFAQWPTSCVTPVSSPPACVGNNVNQPSVAGNPNNFYLCPSANASPALLTCASGQGFVANSAGDLGCVEWSLWRNLTGCVSY